MRVLYAEALAFVPAAWEMHVAVPRPIKRTLIVMHGVKGRWQLAKRPNLMKNTYYLKQCQKLTGRCIIIVNDNNELHPSLDMTCRYYMAYLHSQPQGNKKVLSLFSEALVAESLGSKV